MNVFNSGLMGQVLRFILIHIYANYGYDYNILFQYCLNYQFIWSKYIIFSIVNATTASTTITTTTPVNEHDDLPNKGAAEEEHQYSMTIFFILLVMGKKIIHRIFFINSCAEIIHEFFYLYSLSG